MRNPPGALLAHLPAIFHDSKDLRRLLSIFEAVLLGSEEGAFVEDGLERSFARSAPFEERIAAIASLFDAYETPGEFLPWLAQWVALTNLAGLSEPRRRDLLASIVPLYARRGTRGYLEELLSFFIPPGAFVLVSDHQLHGFVLGETWIGRNSRLEEEQPYWFRVTVQVTADPDDSGRMETLKTQWEARIRTVIDLAKPAHTLYELHWQSAANGQ